MALDALLTNSRLRNGWLFDIRIAGGRIATLDAAGAAPASNSLPVLDLGGDLVLPGLVDGHLHLNKTRSRR